jgi:hypothetical protein
MKCFRELKDYTVIDAFRGNIQLSANIEKEKRLNIYRNYKFVIAFENMIDKDYVTDRFYEPLVAGSVPIYLGAPNIEDFAPGDNCFVDIRQFNNPQLLANFINACYEDDHLYVKFFEWKRQPLKQSFLRKLEIQKEHPLLHLCRKIEKNITFINEYQ